MPMKRLLLVWVMILCLMPICAWADLDYLQAWEETAPEDRAPFDAVAAFSGRWRLERIEFDDDEILTRQELTDIGYDEAVTFTALSFHRGGSPSGSCMSQPWRSPTVSCTVTSSPVSFL